MRGVFDGDTEFSQVASELFDTIVVSLDGISSELLQTTCQPFSLADLTRSNTWSLFVKDILHFDGEDLTEGVKLLGTFMPKKKNE